MTGAAALAVRFRAGCMSSNLNSVNIFDFVAQLVEHSTFNRAVVSSSLTGVTFNQIDIA